MVYLPTFTIKANVGKYTMDPTGIYQKALAIFDLRSPFTRIH